jgi:alpha-tubulin suppressor-like RCC1 family protein
MVIQKISFGGGYQDSSGTFDLGACSMWLQNPSNQQRFVSAGANNWGNIGNGSVGGNVTTPVTASGFTGTIQDVQRMGCAAGSVWILTTTGTLWNWGFNEYGALGRGNTTNSGTPQVAMTGVAKIWAGDISWRWQGWYTPSIIIEKTDGTYWRCGQNDQGYLGDGTQTQRTSFVKMRFPTNFRMAYFGAIHTLDSGESCIAVDQNNKVYVWGYNTRNTIYSKSTSNILIPYENTPRCLYY